MSSRLPEAFEIETTFAEFQAWVNNYKTVYETRGRHLQFKNYYRGDDTIYWYYPIRRDETEGHIRFECQILGSTLIRVNTTLLGHVGQSEAYGEFLVVIYRALLGELARLDRNAPAEYKPYGRHLLGSTVWLLHMVHELHQPLGRRGQANNQLYDTWKMLWAIEHPGMDPDNPSHLGDAWDSYTKAAKLTEN